MYSTAPTEKINLKSKLSIVNNLRKTMITKLYTFLNEVNPILFMSSTESFR